MKVEETKTIRRRASIDLPIDKVVAACKEIARAEGYEVPDHLPWYVHIPLFHAEETIHLVFDETIETNGEADIK